jgi:6-phosphogluconolactonase
MNPPVPFYVGTYAAEGAAGIHRCLLDPATGRLSRVDSHCAGANPSFLALHPSGRCLYAVNELRPGFVSAFAIHPEGGGLTLVNREPSQGTDPCHLTTDRSGRYLLVANYSSGALAVYPLGPDGRLSPACSVVQHQGRGPDPKRQEGPHAHSVTFDPTRRFVLACDLGLDKVFVYRFDHCTGSLLPHSEALLHPDAGPRHLEIHQNGRYVYVINELDITLTVLAWSAQSGALTAIQTVTARYGDGTGPQASAEVAVHPSGRFVFASVRGCDSVVVFGVDEQCGKLAYASHVSCGGRTPRHIAIDPSGALLLAANQDSDLVVSFGVDSRSGRLKQLSSLSLPKPVCVTFGNRKTAPDYSCSCTTTDSSLSS